MEPAVRVELTTNGLQIRCSATELRRQMFSRAKISPEKRSANYANNDSKVNRPIRVFLLKSRAARKRLCIRRV